MPRRTPPHWAPWRNTEENRLRELYPTAPKADILSEFPGRAWTAICQRARSLGIKRLECMPRTEILHPVVGALLAGGLFLSGQIKGVSSKVTGGRLR